MHHRWYFIYPLGLCLVLILVCGCSGGNKADVEKMNPDPTVMAFYYPWYGNPATDGQYRHWNHQILDPDNPGKSFPGGDNIGANFYPLAGCYSSNDEALLDSHMQQLHKSGIGQICVSWWGRDSFEDKTIPTLLDAADRYGIKLSFHIEPYGGRSSGGVAEAIKYIIDRYGSHPAFYRDQRYGNRPFFFIYDSYQIEPRQWADILAPDRPGTLRGTAYDAVILGLWIGSNDGEIIIDGHFDGFYTYFATDEFTYGSGIANWPRLAEWAGNNGKIFIPCVGPGYLDTRIRPWNTANTRLRDHGGYYDLMWAAAVRATPPFIGITSFNEWHEGTQIEMAVPKKIDGFMYNDYSPWPPDYYLTRTRHWVDIFRQYAERDSGDRSKILPDDKFVKDIPIIEHLGCGKRVETDNPYSPKYDAGGEMGLVDGLRGGLSYLDGRWQGYEYQDFSATLDLGGETTLAEISVDFLQAAGAWIFLPQSVEFSISTDGTNYNNLQVIENTEPWNRKGDFIKTFICSTEPVKARFIRVHAKNIGSCPDGHPGTGGKAWLFVDEIIVR